ncbi:histidine--tRNA ligase [Intrasporangium calvum]|uniref:Histidine--tRNA ligase n=1 Tax=Intrasporangium calvum (strain ATCC 23552 / DSM 43043 / JCM 3097 / NBRC 12989 / NCIMB 10167 / NRRL B-3866 / 7 KIP) TaxID=710696 RepID=E6SB69_INTC7|nr:histidine--tRNA ligase [Intrasporangium calvum]ADU48357.1 histidyl-tRNA synthetase [Intrasporangium calvum DSM 43043]
MSNPQPATASATKVTPISGFPEYLPAERIVEQRFLDVIRETFELHGFSSIETRAIEPVDRLLGKGGDTDKEIYGVSRLAGDEAEGAKWGLHFDLTVPFARYVLENAGKLSFPFRRYQIQKAWRGERPQEGRYREFTQADIDVVDVGQLSPHFEAEMPLVIADVFSRFPVGDFVIQVNNRKIPNGFYQGIGLTDVPTTLRIVDKLDKIGPTKVAELLVESGATPQQADLCLALAAIRTEDLGFVDRVRELGVTHPLLDEGLESLSTVIRTAMAHAPGKVVADLRIARGLDYYTGTVYETQFIGHEEWGSFCSGGRYDALASDGRNTYPGVGISIGVSRILGLLVGQGLVTASRSTPAAVLVALTDDESRDRSVAVAAALRARGVSCEVAPAAARFGKQIRYAERRGIPYVWFPGAGESGDEVKDIRTGEQVPAGADAWLPPGEDLVPRVARAD